MESIYHSVLTLRIKRKWFEMILFGGGPVKNGDMDARNQPALPPEKVYLCQYSGLTRLQWNSHPERIN